MQSNSDSVDKYYNNNSLRLAQLEAEYTRIGNQHHSFSLPIRSSTIPDFVRENCEKAFEIKQQDIPNHIESLITLRNQREEAKRLMRNGEADQAEILLVDDMEPLLDDLENELEVLALHVTYHGRRASSYREEMEGEAELRENMHRSWILALPEVASALERGIYRDLEEAFALMIKDGVEQMECCDNVRPL